MSENTKSKKRLIIDLAIILLLMFGSRLLPTFGPLTKQGVQILGIFLGCIYGWGTNDLVWTSLLGAVAMVSTGLIDMANFYMQGFGSTTIIFIVSISVLLYAEDKFGVINFISNWLLSRKYLEHKPWRFTVTLIFAAYITCVLAGPLAAMFFFWPIVYKICKMFDIKPYDSWPTYTIIGIVVAALIGWAAMPYKILAIGLIGMFKNATGILINFGAYIILMAVMGILILISYCILGKFIFRVDVSKLSNISSDIVDKSTLVLNKAQKYLIVALVVMLISLIIPPLLPRSSALYTICNTLDSSGFIIIIDIILMIITVEGKPLLDFKNAMKNGVEWSTVVLTAVILPLAGLITNDATGIKPLIVGLLQPVLSNVSPVMYMVIVVSLGVILTNFANNAVIGIILITLSIPLSTVINFPLIAIVALIIFSVHIGILTPAASPLAAIMHSNKDWLRTKDVYKYGVITIIIVIIIVCVVGIPLSSVLFK